MKEVKVYTAPNCPYCYALKSFLKEKGVEFKEIDVSKDFESQKYLVEKTRQLGVPVLEYDNQFIIGFDKEKVCQLLNIKE